jgi:glycolate oxidase FAD binding subunit
LGIIAQANFRLHPIPEAARTVAVSLQSPQEAQEAAQAIMHSQVEATAVELHWGDEARLLTVLVESIPAGVEAKAETASFLLRPFGEVRSLEEGEMEFLGPLRPPELGDDEAAIKIAAPPAELAGVLDSVFGAAERRGVKTRMTARAASGVTLVGLSGGDTGAQAEFVEELREIWTRRGCSVVLQRAPADLKKRVGTWSTGGRDDLGLMRRVKEKFDPRGGLNPGRFIGGI